MFSKLNVTFVSVFIALSSVIRDTIFAFFRDGLAMQDELEPAHGFVVLFHTTTLLLSWGVCLIEHLIDLKSQLPEKNQCRWRETKIRLVVVCRFY